MGRTSNTQSSMPRSWLTSNNGARVALLAAAFIGWRAAPDAAPIVINPGDDIAARVAGAPPGSSFLIKAGLYRTQTITPKDGDTITGEPGAVLSGAVEVKSFVQQGSFWVATVPLLHPGTVKGQCRKQMPGCQYPEDLFLDDNLLKHVTLQTAVGSGSWYLDYSTGNVYLGDNPVGHRVELSVVPRAFAGGSSGVTLTGLTIEKFAAASQDAALHGDNTRGWVVRQNEFRWNHSAGIKTGSGMQVIGNNIHHNGQEGLAAYLSTNVLVQDNEIAYNNTAGYDPEWEAGGTKFAGTDSLVVRNNRVHHNQGKGLWTDVDNIHTLYDGNTVTDNTDQGIFHEISYDALIKNNDCERNGFGNANNALSGSGILVASSSNVEIAFNKVVGNANGIGARQENRGAGKYGPYILKNLYVHDNAVQMDRGFTGVAIVGGSDPGVYTALNNRFVNNTYVMSGSARFLWQNGTLSLDQWRALRMDAGSANP